jgi:DNA polymerase
MQIAWGADEALDEAPVDRTQVRRTQVGASARVVLLPPAVVAMPETAVARARVLAGAAVSIAALREALAGFTECPLAATATNLVFADGNASSGVVLIGEAPGEEEDRTGLPFSGPAGVLLDRMLGSIGLDRTRVLLTTLVPWRPPGGRLPTDSEVQQCLPFVQRHLALLSPRVVVTLGQLPTRALSGRSEAISRMRGRWRTINIEGLEAVVSMLPMFNPAHLLHTPAAKKEAWADLRSLYHRIAQL